jgi:glucose/arabinose dehydrogenase
VLTSLTTSEEVLVSLLRISKYMGIVATLFFLITSFIIKLNPVSALSGLEPGKIRFQEVASGLTQPLFVTNAGDGSGRLFIVERAGYIRILKNGSLLAAPFLDIHTLVNSSSSEQGLLALAFHPNYASNGRFYTVYVNQSSQLVLSQFTRSANDPDLANLGSRVQLLAIDHPTYANHNGGTLAFGPDGYLYWSTGDGGGGGDPNNNAQNLSSLLGKILRLDVSSGSSYAIPTSNPFYNNPSTSIRKEIWSYGLRNPWRISFDRQTGDLYIADVGQGSREEIDFQSSSSSGGENYGWRVMEGSLCYNPATGCDKSGKVLPVAQYDHTLGCSVSGGYVYRGSNYPSLKGHYFYADYCSGRLFDLYRNSQSTWVSTQLLDTAYSITSFGEAENGELYLMDYDTGKVYQIQYQEASVDIRIAGTLKGNYSLPANQVLKTSYQNVQDGPVKVTGVGQSIFTSQRAIYNNSFNEVMGYPGSQLTTEYWFPWYDNVSMDTWILVGNASSSQAANVEIYVGAAKFTYTIPANGHITPRYIGKVDGPVRVRSTNGIKIFVSERALYNGSFNEVMGFPASQLTTDYWFPLYDNASMDTWILVGNPSTTQKAEVSIYIGAAKYNYTIAPQGSITPRYAGVQNGPVRVASTNGVKIFTSERSLYGNSFNEVMGFPASQFTTDYWFPWYDNISMADWVLVGNPSSSQSASVEVSIGAAKYTYIIPAGGRITPRFAGKNVGPVRVRSTNGVKIFTSQRVTYNSSFNEVMGVPGNQLTTEYWFPWYDSTSMSTDILVGRP